MKFTISELACAAALTVFAVSSHAATEPQKTIKNEYNAAITRADADYKAAKENCKGQQGNDKDVCLKEAKANYVQAKSDATAARKAQVARADARDDKIDAQYAVAKQKCEALTGDAEDACIAQAKLKYHQ